MTRPAGVPRHVWWHIPRGARRNRRVLVEEATRRLTLVWQRLITRPARPWFTLTTETP